MIIDGRLFCSLGHAADWLKDPKGGPRAGGEANLRLLQLLQSGQLSVLRRLPAPAHQRPEFAGEVELDGTFWAEAWWWSYSGHDTSASEEWISWLNGGGVVVPSEEIGEQVKLLTRERQIELETKIRNTFQPRWPAQHALAWIISRSDEEVREIDVARSLDLRTAWEMLWDIAGRYRREGQLPEQVLFAAFDRLLEALDNGDLEAWKLSHPYLKGDLSRLDLDTFAAAGMMIDINSCGLLGATIDANSAAFVLMRPRSIRAVWPAQPSEPPPARISIAPHSSDVLIADWMRDSGERNQKAGWSRFKAERPFADEVKNETFLKIWNETFKRSRGRPRTRNIESLSS
jgi:hypothetical protein